MAPTAVFTRMKRRKLVITPRKREPGLTDQTKPAVMVALREFLKRYKLWPIDDEPEPEPEPEPKPKPEPQPEEKISENDRNIRALVSLNEVDVVKEYAERFSEQCGAETVKRITAIYTQLNTLLIAEAIRLDAMGLPVPKLSLNRWSRQTYKEFGELRVETPWFNIPWHIVETFTRPQCNRRYTVGKGLDRNAGGALCRQMTYVICVESKEMRDEELSRYKRENGIVKFLERYPNGHWCNRAPYRLFQILNGKKITIDEINRLDPQDVGRWSVLPLDAIRPPTPAEWRQWRQHLFFVSQLLPEKVYKNGPSAYSSYQLPANFPSFSVPDLKEDRHHLLQIKVLPHPDDSHRVTMVALLESLQRLSALFRFELIAEHGTAYFQITVSYDDREVVQRQLAALFPNAVVNVKDVYDPEDRFAELRYVRYFLPQNILSPQKTLKDFTVDPFAHIGAVIDRMKDDETLSLSVLCQPFPEDFHLGELVGFFEKEIQKLGALNDAELARVAEYHPVYKSFTKREMTQALTRQKELLERKKVPWGVAIRLAGSSVMPFSAFEEVFWPQYETIVGGRWDQIIFSESDWQKRAACREPVQISASWAMLSSEELAAFVHFPDKSVRCERLEMATNTYSGPPDIFLAPK